MEDVGIFKSRQVYFTTIWYILWPFGKIFGYFGLFFPVLVCCTEKKLAALFPIRRDQFLISI
jgi:hypothetical protein